MNNLLIIISSSISILYAVLMLLLIIGMYRLPYFKPISTSNTHFFSVIVPFRNEAENLMSLLHSFQKLNYPLHQFEIILVDDFSNDESVCIIEQFRTQHPSMPIHLISNQHTANSPKKNAIELALKIAQYEWIITTDADCIVPFNWLKTFDDAIQQQACDLLVAPVIFSTDSSFFYDFQQLDFLSLMGATQGGFGIGFPFLCNGANLCYRKAAFIEVNGFNGNETIASGDDIFLMEKLLARDKKSVIYINNPEAIVLTKPQRTVKDFVNQRIRWASKSIAFKNKTGQLVGFLVLSMNLALFLSLFFMIFDQLSVLNLLSIWLLKMGIDFIVLKKIAKFFNLKISSIKYAVFSFMYPIYSVFIGVLSFGKGYEWKGRRF